MIKRCGIGAFAILLSVLLATGVVYLFIVTNSYHKQNQTAPVSDELPPIPIRNQDFFFHIIGSGTLVQAQQDIYSQTSASRTQVNVSKHPYHQDRGEANQYSPEERFVRAVRKNEAVFNKIAVKYTLKHQFIRQYGIDWMEYPDLKKLNDEYFIHHDPIRFASDLVRSENFRKLLKKYSTRPEFSMFITDIVKNTPSDIIEALSDYLSANPKAMTILNELINISGIPTDLFASLKNKKTK
ncbi:MAG: hypothetical protein HY746_09125 [Elusimicrobia bacterium]|nr:hypothetical protein [Elusimicrobiota bacterium]